MAAFGVTLSLTEKTPQQIIAYLEKMQQLQVGSVFSSLQIPGDDPGTLQDTLAQVGPLFRRQGLEFVVDVSPRTFRNFTLEQLRSWQNRPFLSRFFRKSHYMLWFYPLFLFKPYFRIIITVSTCVVCTKIMSQE